MALHFGLTIPQNAIDTLLRRLRKRKYITLKDKIYRADRKRLDALKFRDVQQLVLEMQELLLDRFRDFCLEKFDIRLSSEEADAALRSFLEDEQFLVTNIRDYTPVLPRVKNARKNSRFLVGSFIQYLQQTQGASLDYLDQVAKGHMLANALFLPDIERASRKFNQTEVYLDTTFLIYALGYAGEARQEPCIELLELLYETGAHLRCFRHTYEEIREVLDACQR
jgi:hypothetical protein